MNPAVAPASRIAIQALNSPGVGGFGRSAQAAWLLDGVLRGLSMTDPDQKRAHLTECDRKLQSFLAVVMQQHGGKYGIFCVSIALTIRALFLLHWNLLGSPIRVSPRVYDSSNSSHQTLDTITKMVIDIATAHEHLPFSQIDRLPPSFGDRGSSAANFTQSIRSALGRIAKYAWKIAGVSGMRVGYGVGGGIK
ncbi:hypothetical protein N7527_005388 [Penicillium freii]|nr:hypothetical protein N7527_005388 [Penicillium freii]